MKIMSHKIYLPASLAVFMTTCVLPTIAVRAAEHVVHISIDGCNAAMLKQLIDSGKGPNLKRLCDEGISTFNARTDYTETNTLPNHTCMFTGRPVAQPEGMPDTTHHGLVENKAPKRGDTLHTLGNKKIGYIASIFDVIHDAGMSTGLYAAKDKFGLYDVSYDEHHGADHANGRDKIDVYFTRNDGPPRFSESVNRQFLEGMAKRHFNYVFLHFRDTDTIGHALSWGSGGWFYALQNSDAYLGEVLKLIETDPELAGKTVVMITADHGGIGYGHSDENEPQDFTIPLIVWGAGVGRGDLYAMNRDTRTEPAKARVPYSEEGQPIRNGDTGNLALSLLGLGPIPGSLINAKQDLRVAAPGDYNLDGNVDAADSVLWKKLKDSNDPRADGNRDGKVDQADYDIWKANLGQTVANP
jgi:hypothetical protein